MMKTTNKMWMASVLVGCLVSGMTVLGAEAEWLTDMAKAQEKAKAEKKLILVNFTGSDWCPPCMRMKAEVLTQKEFVEYAQKNLVLVEADFPRRTAQSAALKRSNQALQKKYGIQAYPTFVLLDAAGKELWRHESYLAGGPKAFLQKLERVKGS
jgi:thioredoxin-related protein